jgi:subtilase family serine protease
VQVKGPDLIETSVTNPPQIFKVGSTFAVTDTVKNQGNVDTGPSVTQYYLSGNTLKDKGDILLIGGRYVIGLAPGEALMGTESLKIPSDTPPGAYYLLACADDMENVGETDEKNNCIASTTKVQVIP